MNLYGGPPTLRRIGLFVGLTFGLSLIPWSFIVGTGRIGGGNYAYVTLLMWCPGLAALAACRLSDTPLSSLGWSWGSARWTWESYLLPLAYAASAYAIIWSMGLGSYGNSEFLAATQREFGWTRLPIWAVTGGYFFWVATTSMVSGVAVVLGEEIGWRGYLAPLLYQQLGYTKSALAVGFIWATWHLPLILGSDYRNPETPLWFAVLCFYIMIAGICFPLTWLRLRSGSLWPAAILHASHNNFIQGFFTPLTGKRGWITPYAIDEFGFVLALCAVVIAIGYWRRRGSLALPGLSPGGPA